MENKQLIKNGEQRQQKAEYTSRKTWKFPGKNTYNLTKEERS